ncbi:MAG TPA: hypothetical protein DEE98_08685 [Elusimicrobia bacterium]|nr:MAG: hypothetical protein A2278_05275 [Elusimicrobia bacterium RIFOXYA12_FULL_49_49]OGS09431.1 MAG: hypothetical protein A2204_01945 [Elusimicrobia bacterium RIFOXYA1_FULL_47_7]OGS11393.1 MAG: hypothetical protein A2386_06320 [Elusimicrobia bacterium RIFOXYB1_FULL_48_9]OGS16509.1 MAG: hypothetical protein A2251_06785 [Elusimicrobia bacterium RIFOXYA2_FULL_47_53]OGS25904.1 MAG: hypothetical protein A2339_00800 [Elusimicrobia bacterium RIFOXYB12_FULL_50_12]OGS31246.1 MAG: hypothetical protein
MPGNSSAFVWIIKPLMKRDLKGVFRYARGAKWPAWFILALPFLIIYVYVYFKTRKYINWTAALAMIIFSEIMLTITEHICITRGHWVYNDNRILGPRIWGIPIEEPLIYYWIPQLFVVFTMLIIYNYLRKRARKKGAA